MRFLLYAAVSVTLLAAGSVAGEDKMYKWVDEDGNVTYQDRPPPDESGQVQTFQQPSSQSPEGTAFPDVAVTLYSIEQCDACDLVRKLLNERGMPFTEKDADNDAEIQAELKEAAGKLSVPVLVIGDEALTGYNKELILNELEEAGFPTTPGAAAQARTQPEGGSSGSGQLSREDLEGMTPEEIEQAARDAALRGEDNDLFDEDEGFLPNEDIFNDDNEPAADDVTQWEEIPEDERIRVGD